MTPCLIALGANSGPTIGANARRIAHAVRALPGHVIAVSALYRTPAFPPESGPAFVNAAICLHCRLAPAALLAHLHRIEASQGRTRALRWGTRTLDLDLIAVGNLVRPGGTTLRHWMTLPEDEQRLDAPDELILPHPRMQDRAFVLIPLNDIAPGWRHPATGWTVRSMVEGLSGNERREIRRIGPVDGVVNRKRRA